MFVLKGFPTEVSDYIELPDMAELLFMPIFVDTPIEEVYKYGTDFQKKLVNKINLRNDRRLITVTSGVKLLDPFHRSCTGFSDDVNKEWHIDAIEEINSNGSICMDRWYEETDVVHLFTSKSTSMTEFNKNEIFLPFDHPANIDAIDFHKYIHNNLEKLGIEGQLMPENKIVTFTNHLHRATPSKQIEFKYMLRVVETDRKREPLKKQYDPKVFQTIYAKNYEQIPNMLQQKDKITIFLPETIYTKNWYLGRDNNKKGY